MYASSNVLGGFRVGDRFAITRKPLIIWSHPPGSNRRPADYESAALPTELGWPALSTLTTCSGFRNLRFDAPSNLEE